MLLCVCLNPAVDVTYRLDGGLAPGESHRVAEVGERAGGKGVNVARVLRQLGTDAVVLGFAGGPNGEVLRAGLRQAGLVADLVDVAGATRRTVAIVDPGRATALNEPGPLVSAAEWAGLRARFRDLLEDAEVVVLSGSLPPGLPPDAYAVLTRLARDRGRPVIVDADGPALRRALPAGPALVKPNLAELRDFTGETGPPVTSAAGLAWLTAAAGRLRDAGAASVVVSLGSEGLVALTPDGAWRATAPEVPAGNPTGAGDALVAVLARDLATDPTTGRPWPDRLRDAVAISAAAVTCPLAGETDLALATRLAPSVMVQQLPIRRFTDRKE